MKIEQFEYIEDFMKNPSIREVISREISKAETSNKVSISFTELFNQHGIKGQFVAQRYHRLVENKLDIIWMTHDWELKTFRKDKSLFSHINGENWPVPYIKSESLSF